MLSGSLEGRELLTLLIDPQRIAFEVVAARYLLSSEVGNKRLRFSSP